MSTQPSSSQFLARSRFLVVAILGAYVTINILLAATAPFTQGWSTLAVTSLTMPPMVVMMVYAIIPAALRFGSR